MSIVIAVAALLLLRLGFLAPRATLAISAAALLLAAFAGLTLPDIDQPLWLDHRSAVTHSILPAIAVLVRRWALPVASGLGFGTGLHLSADLFPNAMIGFATVKVPFAGSIGAEASYAWIAINLVACLWLGGFALRQAVAHEPLRRLVLGAVALLGAFYLLRVDGGWAALALFLAIGVAALYGSERLGLILANRGATTRL